MSKIIITIEVDGDEVKVLSTEKKETDKIEEVIEQYITSKNLGVSQYARYFDDGCIGWTKDPEFNKLFLLEQQHYANDLLRQKGHLFLNEVYDMLGIPRSSAGQVVGWICDEDDPLNDYDRDLFGLYSEQNRRFINGLERVALLDFDVDGNILDRI